ncbi:hypothetical protein GCM10011428_27870 [Streptomyces violaceus]
MVGPAVPQEVQGQQQFDDRGGPEPRALVDLFGEGAGAAVEDRDPGGDAVRDLRGLGAPAGLNGRGRPGNRRRAARKRHDRDDGRECGGAAQECAHGCPSWSPECPAGSLPRAATLGAGEVRAVLTYVREPPIRHDLGFDPDKCQVSWMW